MFVVCDRCQHRGQIGQPRVGAPTDIRDTASSTPRDRRTYQLSARRAPPIAPDPTPFDDDVADLFKVG
jgi:hypothetical protein